MNTTGSYDRQAAGRELTARRTAELAADPFAGIGRTVREAARSGARKAAAMKAAGTWDVPFEPAAPQGWALVFAQTRHDETGVMTLPLTGFGLGDEGTVTEPYEVPGEFALTGAELAELLDEQAITEAEAIAAGPLT